MKKTESKKKEEAIPVVQKPIAPPLSLNEFEIVVTKENLPLWSRDPEERSKQMKEMGKTCPMVLAGSYLWVDHIADGWIRLHPMNPNDGRHGLVFIGVQASGVFLHQVGDFVNHPDRWTKYGKVGGKIMFWAVMWSKRFGRAWDALRGR
jgi:hypothetical protein